MKKKKLFAWFVANTCCGEIFDDLFCSFNFDSAANYLKSHYLDSNYELLVLYYDEYNYWDYDILEKN